MVSGKAFAAHHVRSVCKQDGHSSFFYLALVSVGIVLPSVKYLLQVMLHMSQDTMHETDISVMKGLQTGQSHCSDVHRRCA